FVAGGETASGGGQQLAAVAQVDADAVDREQLGGPLERGLQRVREGEPRDRLADDRQECARPVELELELTRALAGAQRVRGANAERRQRTELALGRRIAVEKLEDAERRLAELDRDDEAVVPLLHRPWPPLSKQLAGE